MTTVTPATDSHFAAGDSLYAARGRARNVRWPGSLRLTLRGTISNLLLATIVLLFATASGSLWHLGINYDGLFGSAASKIHPATYLAVVTFLLLFLTRRNPVSFVATLAARHGGAIALLAVSSAVLAFVTINHRPGMAGLIDTFWLPAFLMIIAGETNAATIARAEPLLHALFTCNALLSIFELLSGAQVFPYRFDGEVLLDNRPAGLQGHALTNATMTGTYVVILLRGGATDLPKMLKMSMVTLQLASIVASGGRTVLIVIIALLTWQIVRRIIMVLSGARMTRLQAALAFAAPSIVAILIVLFVSFGFFDKLAARFQDDTGSSQARVQMFEVFQHLPVRDLLLAPDVEFVEAWRRARGLDTGIENPIVRFLAYQGALVTSALVLCVALLLRELRLRMRRGYGLPMAYFLIVIMSYESLGSKTTLLAKFVIIMLVLFRPVPPRSSAAPMGLRSEGAPLTMPRQYRHAMRIKQSGTSKNQLWRG